MTSKTKDYMFAMKRTLDYAQKKATGVEILLDYAKTLSLSSEKGKISKYQVSSTEIIGVRLTRDNRVGISYCESFNEEMLHQMVDDAVMNSRFSDEKENEQISVQGKKYSEPPHYTYVEEEIPLEDKINVALALESELMAKDKDMAGVPYNGLTEVEGGRMVMNHWGTLCTAHRRYYSCYTYGLLKKNGKESMFMHSDAALSFHDLNWQKCVDEAYKHSLGLLEGAPVPTGNYEVILSAKCMEELFNCFGIMTSAKAAIEGHNPFRDKIGQQVASPLLTLSDRPLYTEGLAYSTFDAEGTMKQDLTFIERGIFKSFFHNTATAKQMRTENTGHASRGAKNALDVSGQQIVISPGHTPEKNLFHGEYLEIISLQGLHSGTNPISGDFSLGASGYLCQDGQIKRPVRQITISGNFYKLINQLVAVGDELHDVNRSFFSPLIRFSHVQIAGK